MKNCKHEFFLILLSFTDFTTFLRIYIVKNPKVLEKIADNINIRYRKSGNGRSI